MINDYIEILDKDGLYLQNQKGGLWTHNHSPKAGIIDAYYETKITYPDLSKDNGYAVIEFPLNIDEIIDKAECYCK